MSGVLIKIVAVFIVAAFLFLSSYSSVFAGHRGKGITPYGDFCSLCTDYGTCDKPMTNKGAKKAIIDYYHKKGFNVMIETNRGRFIKAKIMKKDNVVDVIIFDRRTGRIRSTY
jgi:CO dehydrogenase/acetyl-CoA synthase alpha subunit